MCTCGHAGFQEPHGMPGQNVEAMLALTFMEAALGAERVFQASVRLQCPSCTGSGLSAELQPVECIACYGTGQSMRCQSTSLGEHGLAGSVCCYSGMSLCIHQTRHAFCAIQSQQLDTMQI